MEITWIGHSCFKITEGSYSVIIDPYKAVPGLKEIYENANIVLVTHNHSDHNAVDKVKILDAPSVMGITSIELSHDDEGGKVRGSNRGFLIQNNKFKIAHLGDIGCQLTSAQVQTLNGLDVLMIPVGGMYTIDAKDAIRIIELLRPKVAIPMHYRDEEYGFGFEKLADIDVFINSINNATKIKESTLALNNLLFKRQKLFGKYKTKILIMKPQNVKV